MGISKIFRPAPVKEAIEDPDLIKNKYKYWRLRIFYGMYVGYAFYYFTRKSFTFLMPEMVSDLGVSKTSLGIIISIMSITYGCSKFLSGIMSDRSNPRYIMALGLIITGLLNIFFGLSSSLMFFAIFWGLNGWFQGWGWPPCAHLLTHWYSKSERGVWWGVWNSSHNVGGALIPLLVAYVVSELHFGWRVGMYVPGALCICVGLFLLNRLRDTPESLGLPPVEQYRNDQEEIEDMKSKKSELSAKELLVNYVLKNTWIWMLAFSYFFVYIVRQGVNDWGAFYLREVHHFSALAANSCVSWFDIGGLFGGLVAGWASDKLFRSRRGPICSIFSLGAGISAFFLLFIPGQSVIYATLIMFMTGFFIFGPQMLIGMAAAELSHKKAAGTATGFVGNWAYAGGAVAGAPLALIIEKFGWNSFIYLTVCCAAVSVFLLIPLWRAHCSSIRAT